MQINNISAPQAIIGLGNPGHNFERTRHNIGFLILDELSRKYNGNFRVVDKAELAEVQINGYRVILAKPLTYMNNSGDIVPILKKIGISSEHSLVIHDELEFPFGKIGLKFGGSARGHNGLRSIISMWSDKFARLRFGIGRPENKEDVAKYVLSQFNQNLIELKNKIGEAVSIIESLYKK
jgi:PTH1 family peptidyl-tRNA hydrolase